MIARTFGLQGIAIAAAAALALGLAGGIALARWHYAPRLDACQTAKRALGEKVEEQNAAVQKLQDLAEQRQREARVAQDAAAAAARAHEREAQRLLALARPQGVDECTAASALIRQELGR